MRPQIQGPRSLHVVNIAKGEAGVNFVANFVDKEPIINQLSLILLVAMLPLTHRQWPWSTLQETGDCRLQSQSSSKRFQEEFHCNGNGNH